MGKNWILLKKNNFYFELDHSYFLSCVIAIDVNSSTRELRVPLTLRRLAITVRWISIKVKNLRITRRWSAFHFVYSFLMTLQYGRRNSIQQREWTVYTHKRWIMEWTRRGGGLGERICVQQCTISFCHSSTVRICWCTAASGAFILFLFRLHAYSTFTLYSIIFVPPLGRLVRFFFVGPRPTVE